VGLTKQLDLPELQKSGLVCSAGQWHLGIKRFTTDLHVLVEALAQEAENTEGVLAGRMASSMHTRALPAPIAQ
jgi:hypothetical protein